MWDMKVGYEPILIPAALLLSVMLTSAHSTASPRSSTAVGGPQRTPFLGHGPPVFLPSARRGFGRAPGRPAAPRCLRIELCMETACLHAQFALSSYSSRR